MLQNIRDNAQGIIMWIIIGLVIMGLASFILSGYSIDMGRNYVAKVNGVKIERYEYERALNNYEQQMQRVLGPNFNPEMMQQSFIRDSILNGVVERKLAQQFLDEANMRTNPAVVLEEIRKIPQLQDATGKFTSDHYKSTMQRLGLEVSTFEKEFAYDYSLDQLQKAVSASAFTPEYKLNEFSRLQRQQRDVGFIVIPYAPLMKDISVNDDEVKEYYTAHATEFMTQELVKVQYLELAASEFAKSIKVTDAEVKQYYEENKQQFSRDDWSAAEKKIKQLEARLKKGESFEKLAKANSDDTGSAQQGGDLGTFGRGAMVKPFEDSVFSLKPGQVSAPVKSQFGYHLIKLEKIEGEERQARHILVKPVKQTDAFDQVKAKVTHLVQMQHADRQFYEKADQIDKLTYQHQDSLEPAAEQLHLTVKESDFFSRISGAQIWRNQQVVNAAFSDVVLNQGLNSEVIKLSDDHIMVVRMKEHKPAQPIPLDQVKDSITQQLRIQKAKEKALANTNEYFTKLVAGENIANVFAQKNASSWQRVGFIGRNPSFDANKQTIPEEVRAISFRQSKPVAGDKPVFATQQLGNGDSVILAVYAVRDNQATADDKAKLDVLRGQLTQAQAQADQQSIVGYMRKHGTIELNLEKKEEK